jgi:hypothetical protein
MMFSFGYLESFDGKTTSIVPLAEFGFKHWGLIPHSNAHLSECGESRKWRGDGGSGGGCEELEAARVLVMTIAVVTTKCVRGTTLMSTHTHMYIYIYIYIYTLTY